MDKQAIDKMVEQEKENIITFLQEMIRIPSENPPANNKAMVDYLADRLEKMGFAIKVVGKEGMPNVLASLSGQTGGRTLILNPHFDVVPAGDGWTVDPFGGERIDGRIYGRGAYDCKGRLAIFASAMKLLKDNDIPFNGEIILAASGDEETGGTEGIKYLLDHDLLKGDMCIGEGSDEMLWWAHKGLLHLDICIHGKATHGGRCWMGVNAIEKAALVLNWLAELKKKYEAQGSEYPGRFNRFTTINIGKIQGGLKVNSVPDFCRISVDCRIVPDFKTNELHSEIVAGLEKIRQYDPDFNFDLQVLLAEEPEVLEKNSELFQTVQKAVLQWTGAELPYEATYALSDARYFRRAGIPTISFCGPGGPGKGIQGHGVDEFIYEDHLVLATKIMTSILLMLMH